MEERKDKDSPTVRANRVLDLAEQGNFKLLTSLAHAMTNFLDFEWGYAFNYATEVGQSIGQSDKVDVTPFKQQFESSIYRPKKSDVGLDVWGSLAKELEARDVAEVVAISQPISVAIPEPYRSGYETDQCADAAWGLDRIDSVDLSFADEYEW